MGSINTVVNLKINNIILCSQCYALLAGFKTLMSINYPLIIINTRFARFY